MRKTVCALALTLFAVSVFAQDLTVDSEIKTGVVWNRYEDPVNDTVENTVPGSKDDAGISAGRIRFNVNYYNPDIHVGFKFRINWEKWTSSEAVPSWEYAFGYTKFWKDQFTVSIGRLGDSPWGTGGPEMWKELEVGMNIAGMRFEYEPLQVPGLNVGFVLNGFNGFREPWGRKPIPMYYYLMESVIGASYTNEWFLARAALRLDSPVDGPDRDADGNEGVDLVYRVEEYALQKFVPGLRLWALGYFYGIGASELSKQFRDIRNWFFAEYSHSFFTTQFRVGLDVFAESQVLYLKPEFYFNFLNDLIKVGASFEWKKTYFDNANNYQDTWFHSLELRPLLQVNINPYSYVAFEYSFMQEYQPYYNTDYEKYGVDPIKQKQWINLRVGIIF